MSTINAAGRSAAQVQTAIDSATSGADTVVVPSGSATWNSTGITCTKGIILDFTGVTITRGTGSTTLLGITTHATDEFRLTGGTFNNTNPSALLLDIGGGFSNAKFRVDNCTFQTSDGGSYLIFIEQSWGLFDHCVFIAEDNSEMIHNVAWGPSDTSGWGETITPGSGDALYIEDSTFSKYDQTSQFFVGCSGVQSYYGARTVVRYCTFNYCQIDQHGTGGAIGARWWEIYDNDFHIPDHVGGIRNQSDCMQLRAGSGVVFDNTKSGGVNEGSGSIYLYEEDSGYPASYQIGRGKSSNGSPPYATNQVLDPAYCWNNFITPAGDEGLVQDGRDFYSTTQKPGYTPYTYPHPLQSGGGGEPGAGGHGRGHKRGILRRM